MIALMQRILRLAEGYRIRIRLAAVCSFIKGLLGKAPMVLAYYMIAWFLNGTMSGKNCVLVGIALLICLALPCNALHEPAFQKTA